MFFYYTRFIWVSFEHAAASEFTYLNLCDDVLCGGAVDYTFSLEVRVGPFTASRGKSVSDISPPDVAFYSTELSHIQLHCEWTLLIADCVLHFFDQNCHSFRYVQPLFSTRCKSLSCNVQGFVHTVGDILLSFSALFIQFCWAWMCF